MIPNSLICLITQLPQFFKNFTGLQNRYRIPHISITLHPFNILTVGKRGKQIVNITPINSLFFFTESLYFKWQNYIYRKKVFVFKPSIFYRKNLNIHITIKLYLPNT